MDEEWRENPSPQVQYEHYEIEEKIPVDIQEKPKKKSPKKKKESSFGRKIWKTIVLAVVFGMIAGGTALGIFTVGAGKVLQQMEEMKTEFEMPVPMTENVPEKEAASADLFLEEIGTVASVAQSAMPSVVAITSVSVQEIPNFFGFGFGYREYPSTGSGSGIIVGENEEELLIATNNHVVEGAKTVTVCFIGNDVENVKEETLNIASGDGDINVENSVTAKIKGTDPENDLAVLAVAKTDIPKETMSQIKIAKIGSSDQLPVGAQVVAIGNALGYGQSVTSGWISALNRSVTTREGSGTGLIQTDAAINPGNSGGALLNMKGELIGINSVKYADENVEGMGYAIPISKARPILEELMNRKTRVIVEGENAAYMGVQAANLSYQAIRMYNMPEGAFIVEVTPNEAADLAGLKKGDIIMKIDGQRISGREELSEVLQYYEAGETVEVIYQRAYDGYYKESSLDVTFGKRP